MSYAGSTTCRIPSTTTVMLVELPDDNLVVDRGGDSGTQQTVIAGDQLTTMVRASNYCDSNPVGPVTVAFVADSGARVVATPLSPTDVPVLPPCNGPGEPATIEMQPWTR